MAATKALLINTESGVTIPVMFNPPEYQLQHTNQFAEVGIPGLGSSLLQFVRGQAQTLTMELFFDTSDGGGDVRTHTARVLELTSLDAHTHAPPRLLFIWGSLVFPCVLESVSQKLDLFNAAGLPLRATLDVTFKGYDLLETVLARIPLQSSDRTKRRVVKSGETLQGIAAEEYGDPRQWRPIAEASRLDDPLALAPGQVLTIPTL